MPEDRQILFISGLDCPTVYGRKLPYCTRPELAGTYLPNPYHPPYDRVPVAERFGPRTAGWSASPSPRACGQWPQYQLGYRLFVR